MRAHSKINAKPYTRGEQYLQKVTPTKVKPFTRKDHTPGWAVIKLRLRCLIPPFVTPALHRGRDIHQGRPG